MCKFFIGCFDSDQSNTYRVWGGHRITCGCDFLQCGHLLDFTANGNTRETQLKLAKQAHNWVEGSQLLKENVDTVSDAGPFIPFKVAKQVATQKAFHIAFTL